MRALVAGGKRASDLAQHIPMYAATLSLREGKQRGASHDITSFPSTLDGRDDYIGDAILATFGVSEDGGTHATNALTCAREMLSIMKNWNAERVAAGKEPLGVGIGVNYGPAVVGDIGSERYMDFTVIGDTVNVASRLERLTRSIDTESRLTAIALVGGALRGASFSALRSVARTQQVPGIEGPTPKKRAQAAQAPLS